VTCTFASAVVIADEALDFTIQLGAADAVKSPARHGERRRGDGNDHEHDQ
jgi:hypothetical protein